MADFDFIAVRDTIATQLATPLASTSFYKYPIGDQTVTENTTDGTREFVMLGELSVARDTDTFGPSGLWLDVIDLECLIQVEKAGATDTIASDVETRAQTLLNAVETGLATDRKLGDNVLISYVSAVRSTNGATERGRAVQVEFTITTEVHNS